MQTQNICVTIMQCWTNVEEVVSTWYECHTNVLCLPDSGLSDHADATVDYWTRGLCYNLFPASNDTFVSRSSAVCCGIVILRYWARGHRNWSKCFKVFIGLEFALLNNIMIPKRYLEIIWKRVVSPLVAIIRCRK